MAITTNGGGNYCAYSNYGGNFLVFGAPKLQSSEGSNTMAYIRDGVSNTLFIAERYGNCGSSGDPNAASTWANLWADSNRPWLPSFCMNGPLPPTTPYAACLPFQVTPDWINQCDSMRAQSPHSGGMNVGVGDGSVRFVGGSISSVLWANLCDPRDGNPLGSDADCVSRPR